MRAFLSRRTDVTTVKDVFKPFYRFAQPFGFLFIKLRNDGQFIATTSCVRVVGLLLNCAISSIAIAASLPTIQEQSSKNESKILRQGFQWSFLCTTISQLLCKVFSIQHRHRFVNLLVDLGRIDYQLAVYKLFPDHWLHYRCICCACIYIGLVLLATSLASSWAVMQLCGNAYWEMGVGTTVSAYIQLAYCTILGANVLGLQAIRIRIDALNGRIGRIDSRTDASTVQRMARIFDALNDCCETLNECFAMIVVTCMGTAFVSNVVYMFSMYTLLAHSPHMQIGWILPLSLVWNAHIQVWPLLLAFAGDTMAAAGRRSGQLVHRQLNVIGKADGGARTLWRDVERQMEHFSQQLLHRRPVAHTRLFAVDCSLVFAVSIIYNTGYI